MYPFKFRPILKPILWGGDKICTFKHITPLQTGIGESWELSQVKSDVSVVANGEKQGTTLTELMQQLGGALMGAHVYASCGDKFPLLVKFIDARDNLSIQVHPDDALAAQRHNSLGKTEMWYVISAEPDAGLYAGFSQEITPEEYVERVANDTLLEVLQFHKAQAGDVFFLPAGRVHAIGKGIFIAEIQQSSDITYRIYDYNRTDAAGNPRELHTQLAKDAIDYRMYSDLITRYTPQPDQAVEVVTCSYFTTAMIDLRQTITLPVAAHDSLAILIVLEGEAQLTCSDGSHVQQIAAGDTLLVPASIQAVTLTTSVGAKLLHCYL